MGALSPGDHSGMAQRAEGTQRVQEAAATPDPGQEGKGLIEDEIAQWHHRLSGHEFDQTPGDSEGQGRLVCCNSWGEKMGVT